MPGLLNPAPHAPGSPQRWRRWALYILVIAIVLLPIQFHLLKFVILGAFTLIAADVTLNALWQGRFPYSPVYISVGALTLIFLFWASLSISYGNDTGYVVKDSIGFLIYLTFPFLYCFVVNNKLEDHLVDAILVASGLVVVIHVLSFAGYYLVVGQLTYPKLLATTAAISATGFTWELGASNGVLRANTKAGHFLLMAVALLFYRFAVTKKQYYLLLVGICLVGAIMDGHKALLVALFIFLCLVGPLAIMDMDRRPLKFLVPLVLSCVLVSLTFSFFVDPVLLVDRFSELGSGSFQVRKDQIASLLVEIEKRPVLGNGFGASAEVIRSDLRPFMYEVDFLAVAMKLGFIGALAYFSVYLGTVCLPLVRQPSNYSFVIFALGVAYFFYMGTNGGFAMSPISSFFHLMLFLLASRAMSRKTQVPQSSGAIA